MEGARQTDRQRAIGRERRERQTGRQRELERGRIDEGGREGGGI
jgi:hypothetical protein